MANQQIICSGSNPSNHELNHRSLQDDYEEEMKAEDVLKFHEEAVKLFFAERRKDHKMGKYLLIRERVYAKEVVEFALTLFVFLLIIFTLVVMIFLVIVTTTSAKGREKGKYLRVRERVYAKRVIEVGFILVPFLMILSMIFTMISATLYHLWRL